VLRFSEKLWSKQDRPTHASLKACDNIPGSWEVGAKWRTEVIKYCWLQSNRASETRRTQS